MHRHPYTRQKGAALIISLVLLTMLTTLGVTAMRSNLLDVRIHNNTKSKLVALQCAEAALLAGENWIWESTERPYEVEVVPSQAANQVWVLGTAALAGMDQQDAAWWDANAWSYGTGLSNAQNYIGCSQTPYYIVEKFNVAAATSGNVEAEISFGALASGSGYNDYFRITAYGVGTLDTAPVVLQTTFAKPYN